MAKKTDIQPHRFASRLFTDCEKHVINQLELLGALLGLEHFRCYVYRETVNLLSDHNAIQLLLKRNRANNQ